MKGKLCFKKKKLLFISVSIKRVLGRNQSEGEKRHYHGLAAAAAFISIHACHNMYIFASDGNPSITRGLSDHGGVTPVAGGAGEKPV